MALMTAKELCMVSCCIGENSKIVAKIVDAKKRKALRPGTGIGMGVKNRPSKRYRGKTVGKGVTDKEG